MVRRESGIVVRCALAAAMLVLSGAHAAAQGEGSWSAIKCARYTKASADALARLGDKGLGREFLDRHAAFLASGCTLAADVCPRSAEELNFANVMVMVGMGQGMASTFMPFACRK